MTIETIIRPFAAQDGIAPKPFDKPGQKGAEFVHVQIGLRGGTKTFTTNGSASMSTSMGNRHKEKAPVSQSLQDALKGTGA